MTFAFLLGTGLVLTLPLAVVLAVVVHQLARRQRMNVWGWTVGSAIQVAGVGVAALFLLMTLTSMLERLNQLERRDMLA